LLRKDVPFFGTRGERRVSGIEEKADDNTGIEIARER
jgi:hypothetical protein